MFDSYGESEEFDKYSHVSIQYDHLNLMYLSINGEQDSQFSLQNLPGIKEKNNKLQLEKAEFWEFQPSNCKAKANSTASFDAMENILEDSGEVTYFKSKLKAPESLRISRYEEVY